MCSPIASLRNYNLFYNQGYVAVTSHVKLVCKVLSSLNVSELNFAIE